MEEGFTIEELFKVLTGPDRIRIIKDGEAIKDAYKGLIEEDLNKENLRKETVKRFRCIPELRHKRQKEFNLDPPLHPEDTPQYRFSDLEMRLYYEIYI